MQVNPKLSRQETRPVETKKETLLGRIRVHSENHAEFLEYRIGMLALSKPLPFLVPRRFKAFRHTQVLVQDQPVVAGIHCSSVYHSRAVSHNW